MHGGHLAGLGSHAVHGRTHGGVHSNQAVPLGGDGHILRSLHFNVILFRFILV